MRNELFGSFPRLCICLVFSCFIASCAFKRQIVSDDLNAKENFRTGFDLCPVMIDIYYRP